MRNDKAKSYFQGEFGEKSGGRRRIRTFGGVSQQIYSLPSLAT